MYKAFFYFIEQAVSFAAASLSNVMRSKPSLLFIFDFVLQPIQSQPLPRQIHLVSIVLVALTYIPGKFVLFSS